MGMKVASFASILKLICKVSEEMGRNALRQAIRHALPTCALLIEATCVRLLSCLSCVLHASIAKLDWALQLTMLTMQ